MSPEVAISKLGRDLIVRLGTRLTLIAIDEAHCIQEWYVSN